MTDLTAEMADLWGALGAPPAGHARIIQVVGARTGEGTSTVARELAFFAARRAGRSVWLVDMDLLNSPQHALVASDPARFGVVGEAAAASPDGSMFFTVRPRLQSVDDRNPADARFLAAYRIGSHRWWVTRFRREAMRANQGVHILPSGDYWTALRRYADLVIIDAPAADRSQAALTIAPFTDQTILVVAADQADVRAPAQARDALVAAGATVAGVFFNRATVTTPSFLRRFLP